MTLRGLDLFSGAGGCSVGYARAGFTMTGVDIEPHPDYPYEFVQADAMAIIEDEAFLAPFDFIHASPPCQARTTMSNRWRGQGGKADEHVSLITPVLERLKAWAARTGGVWVLENVPGARKDMPDAITLHGGMFGLGVNRPRLFASNNVTRLTVPRARRVNNPIGVYGKHHDGRRLFTRADGSIQRAARSLKEAQDAMGTPWMTDWRDITEAVPPAYTEYIGHQIMDTLTGAELDAA